MEAKPCPQCRGQGWKGEEKGTHSSSFPRGKSRKCILSNTNIPHTHTEEKTPIPQPLRRHDTGQRGEISPRLVKDSNHRAIFAAFEDAGSGHSQPGGCSGQGLPVLQTEITQGQEPAVTGEWADKGSILL